MRHLLLLLAGKAPNGSELENVICNCMEKNGIRREEKDRDCWAMQIILLLSEKIKTLQKHGRGNREETERDCWPLNL